jgi:hypothetical protein
MSCVNDTAVPTVNVSLDLRNFDAGSQGLEVKRLFLRKADAITTSCLPLARV